MEELVMVQKQEFHRCEGTITCVPCLFFLTDGCTSPSLIRSIFEVNAWLKATLTGELGYILYPAATMWNQMDLVTKKGTGSSFAAPVRLLLPSGMTATMTVRMRWDSGGTNLPAGVPPLKDEEEGVLISMIIGELNSKLRLGLDPSPNLHPQVVGGRVQVHDGAVPGGQSQQRQPVHRCPGEKRLSCDPGYTIPGWSCVKYKIPAMEDLLRRKLAEATEACTVVLQFLDSAFFFTRTEEGGATASKEG